MKRNAVELLVKKKNKNPGTQKKSGQKEALINQPGLKEPQQTQLQLMELQQNWLELTSKPVKSKGTAMNLIRNI